MSESSYSPERSQPIGVGDLPRTLCTYWFFSRGIQFIFSSWIVRHVTEEDYAVTLTTDIRCNCIWSSYLFFSTRYEITFVVSRSVKVDFFFCGFSIQILYGQKWSDGEASTALKYFTLYVVILAVNGTSEAFLHAVATENSLRCWNDSLIVFSLIYLVLNVCLIRSIGAVGLILANSLSILLSYFGSGGFFNCFLVACIIIFYFDLPYIYVYVQFIYKIVSNDKQIIHESSFLMDTCSIEITMHVQV